MKLGVAAFITVVGYYMYKLTKGDWFKVLAVTLPLWWLINTGFLQEPFGSPFGKDVYTYPYAAVDGNGQGDTALTEMYRQLHRLETMERGYAMQSKYAIGGGSYNSNMQTFTGEAYEREMNMIRQRIIDHISRNRSPYDELATPTHPVFISTGPGDDRILGIPSQVGSLPYYY